MTLKTRLLLALTVLVAIALTATGIATYGALSSNLYDRIDQQLRLTQGRALLVPDVLEGFVGSDIGPTLPFQIYFELRENDGTVVGSRAIGSFVPDLPDDIQADPDGTFSTVDSVYEPGARPGSHGPLPDLADPGQFRVLATPALDGDRLLITGLPLGDVEQTLGRLVRIELLVALLVLVALGITSWILVRRELKPLDEMTATAAVIAGGDYTQRVVHVDEATEVGRLGTALNKMMGNIQEAFDARAASEERMRRFLADASHELRTPLTSIRGYSELFRRGAEDRPEDLAVAMRRIEQEAERMGVMVEDLLLLARLDQTRSEIRNVVDLAVLAEDVCRDARAVAPDRDIVCEANDPAEVLGDRDRLHQAVANLIANALRHTPEGTSVEVSVSIENDRVVVKVADQGPGLDPETLEHAFDRFWRADPARTRATGGVGLGLAIVAAITRAHGGEVAARNLPGAGAEFTLMIPTRP